MECRALILEDDRGIGQLFTTILEREGFAVELTRKASDAIERLSRDRYHLLLLDLMVPDRGDEVIEYVKHHQLEFLRSVIVISCAAERDSGGNGR